LTDTSILRYRCCVASWRFFSHLSNGVSSPT